MPIKLRDKYTFDQLSLGEIMLRLDPGEGRIRTAREFKAWEGGGEYNVARGLRKCFGLKTAVCTAFVDNDVGHLIDVGRFTIDDDELCPVALRSHREISGWKHGQ